MSWWKKLPAPVKTASVEAVPEVTPKVVKPLRKGASRPQPPEELKDGRKKPLRPGASR